MTTMNQNAVSMLNEMQQIGRISNISFQETGMTGSSHEPIFTIVAKVTRKGQAFTGTGQASNKKAAKQLAAAAVLKKLGYDVDVEPETSTSEYNTEETAVSFLNRYAQQTGSRMPVYTDGGRWGEDHCPTFMVKVQFRGKSAEGTGASKKAAKEDAARKLKDMI